MTGCHLGQRLRRVSTGIQGGVHHAASQGATITVSYDAFVKAVRGEIVGKLVDTEVVSAVTDEGVGSGDDKKKEFDLAKSPVITRRATFKVTVTDEWR